RGLERDETAQVHGGLARLGACAATAHVHVHQHVRDPARAGHGLPQLADVLGIVHHHHGLWRAIEHAPEPADLLGPDHLGGGEHITGRCMIAAMTMPTMTHPGTVDWSGENPGMYLKENADGPFSTLVSFFRVVASPHGRGHALILLEAPLLHTSIPEALNVCVTDNESLARYLVSEFAAHFDAFKGAEALQSM